MKKYQITENTNFIGRKYEINRLHETDANKEASIIVIYGRRRIGKTELIEQFFINHDVLKFEGIQKDKEASVKENKAFQIQNALDKLASYMEDYTISRLKCKHWTNFFDILDSKIKGKGMVLYFEEVQWLSNYTGEFFAELKPFWDDNWRHNKKLRFVFCGSSPSFIVNQFLSNKALYGRTSATFHLKELSLPEINLFLGNKYGKAEVLLATLLVGGVCAYLKVIRNKKSILSSFCDNAFLPDSYFSIEYEKIFVSSLSSNKHYRNILKILSEQKYVTRQDLIKKLNAGDGGKLTEVLNDLEICGFIEKYSPLHLGENSKLARYTIVDCYLQLFYKFIQPEFQKIQKGAYIKDPRSALNMRSFEIILGFTFERWCRKYNHILSQMLQFGNVRYRSGAYFSKNTKKGFQIDLMYIREDNRIVVCEIKYSKIPVRNHVVAEVENKIDTFLELNPKYANCTIERVLITTVKPADAIYDAFDHVITYETLFDERYW